MSPRPFPSVTRRIKAVMRPRYLASGVLGILGGILALSIAGNIKADIGPFDATFSAALGTSDTEVNLGPLGTLVLDTHSGPVKLRITVDRLSLPAAEQLLKDPTAVDRLQDDVERQARTAILNLYWRCLGLAVVGGAMLALVRKVRISSPLIGGMTAAVMVTSGFGAGFLTFKPSAVSEPRYTGLLALAPRAVGDLRQATDKFSDYRQQVNELVDNLSRLYQTNETVLGANVDDGTIKVIHVSDLHLNPAGFDLVQRLITQFHPAAVVDTGDINDWGTSFESSFVNRISALGVPYIYVRGNHDSMETQAAVASQPNSVVLDASTTEVEGIRFWGIGDPRFTADKSSAGDRNSERRDAERFAPEVLRKMLGEVPPPVDVAVMHDPAIASQLEGAVPLILAGHLHSQSERRFGSTIQLVEGSTGAAGLRGVPAIGDSVPLTCSILYFDKVTHRLKAHDDLRVEGLGRSGARIQRHITEQQ